MGYTQTEIAYFLALVAASSIPEAQGHAEAMDVANNLSPNIPDHLARSAIENFASQELVIIKGKYLDGRTIVKITGKGYQTVEQLSEPQQTKSNPIGFRGKL